MSDFMLDTEPPPPELFIWKWVIRGQGWVKGPDDIEYQGCVAAVVAETKEKAKERLKTFAEDNGISSAWLEVAEVVKLPFRAGVVIAWHH